MDWSGRILRSEGRIERLGVPGSLVGVMLSTLEE